MLSEGSAQQRASLVPGSLLQAEPHHLPGDRGDGLRPISSLTGHVIRSRCSNGACRRAAGQRPHLAAGTSSGTMLRAVLVCTRVRDHAITRSCGAPACTRGSGPAVRALRAPCPQPQPSGNPFPAGVGATIWTVSAAAWRSALTGWPSTAQRRQGSTLAY